jgi:hypothetical protein
MVAVGASVRAVNQPATAGWSGDQLLVKVFPSQSQVEEIDIDRPVTPEPAQGVERLVQAEAGSFRDFVDWGAVRRAASQRIGMAVLVADRSRAARNSAPADDRGAARVVLHRADAAAVPALFLLRQRRAAAFIRSWAGTSLSALCRPASGTALLRS